MKQKSVIFIAYTITPVMKKIILLFTFLTVVMGYVKADTITIHHFVIKENPFATDEIAVVATDTAGTIQENVNGIFNFTINGFEQALTFDKGTAFYRQKLQKSSFIYIKHQNDAGTHSMLYYVYRNSGKLTPIHISWIVLVAIPLALVLLGYLFRKFIIIAAIIFVIFLYFNYHNGLSIPTFFESIIDGLKNMFSKG